MNVFDPTDADPGSGEKIALLSRRLAVAEMQEDKPSIFVVGDRLERKGWREPSEDETEF